MQQMFMIKKMGEIMALLFLAICSVTDMKRRKIYLGICLIFGLFGSILLILSDQNWIRDLLWGLFPGLLLYLISIVSEGGMGKGDAFVFMTLGMLLDMKQCLEIVMLAMLLVVVVSLPYIWIKGKSMKMKVPFIPFVLASFIVRWVVCC